MIPLDTLLQVLSRLPAKSLMRFKCVSKCWYSLIIHPSFVNLYQSQSGQLLVVSPLNFSEYPYRWDRRFYIIDSKKKPKHRVTVHDPCIPFTTNAVTNIVNGLVCFYHDYDEEVCIHIYNLTTHEDLPLPPPPIRSAVKRRCRLGFDPMNKEYKLLLHWWNKSSKRGEGCDVLTIMGRDNAWRPIDISNFPVSIFARDTGFCHDGILYWLSYTYCTYQTALGHLIAFHVEQEKFEYINYTQEEKSPCDERSVCLVEGRLSVVQIPEQRGGNTDVMITLWRQIDRNDNERPLWMKDVINCPFLNYVGGDARCSHFGLVSLVICCKKSEFASIECYNLSTKKHMVLKVNNAQGFLSPVHDEDSTPLYGFRPALLVKNIMPWKSNNIERLVLGS